MFAERLRELRESKKLTQKELASIINVTQGAIGFWERGKREPDYKTLCQLASVFNVSIEYLIGEASSDKIVIMGRNGTYKEINVSEKNLLMLEQLATSLEDKDSDNNKK